MDDIYKNQEFVELLKNFLPNNYIKLDMKKRKELVIEFEYFASKIQKRETLPITFVGAKEKTFFGAYNKKDGVMINEKTLKLPFFSIYYVIFHEGYHHIQSNLRLYAERFSDNERRYYKFNNTYSYEGYIDSGHFLKEFYYF